MRAHSEWNVEIVGPLFGSEFRVPGSALVELGTWNPRPNACRNELRDPFLHFAGRLVRERDAQHVRRRDPALDQVSDAKSDDARLAGARAGQDEHRAVKGLDGLALLGVECTEIGHRARSLVA